MRKQFILVALLFGVIFLSFTEEKNSINSLQNGETGIKTKPICGPSFDSIYNQHSTAFVDDIRIRDPFNNIFYLGFNAEPGDVISISAAGSMCGYAGGTYHFNVELTNPTNGSVKLLDHNNNVIDCENIISTKDTYSLHVTATCATTYKIVVSNSSC